MEWLDGAARSILDYKEIDRYKEAVRVARSMRGVPGLAAEELALRAQLRTAKANVRRGKRLAHLWGQHFIAYDIMPQWDWAVLQNHWIGIDVALVWEIQNRSADRTFKMPPFKKPWGIAAEHANAIRHCCGACQSNVRLATHAKAECASRRVH